MELGGKQVVVMGLGRFGGGIGVARWLCRQGARVTVTDLATQDALKESLAALADLDITFRLGGHDAADLDACDLLVVSPAVDKRTAEFFRLAAARGIPWSSEMNLFIERCQSRIVGVTGTVGKSTTTAMIGAVLDAASRETGWPHGRVWLGGNIGKSLLADLSAMRHEDVVILELSSFQLEDAASLGKSPAIALVTNLRDNHLDRHGTLDSYAAAKANVYRFQTQQDWLVMPTAGGEEHLPGDWRERPRLWRFDVDPRARQIVLREGGEAELIETRVDLSLIVPGLHNLRNASGALAVARILGVSDDVSREALAGFAGLPHRLEFVREYRGAAYYNDSKATTTEAALTSVSAFDRPVVVLAGGSDKGTPFEALANGLVEKTKAVVCMGQTGEAIRSSVLRARGERDRPVVKTAGSFEEAVNMAGERAEPGDVVLLAPACASFDWFKNYEDRGERFRSLVKSWQ
jgi:UDP-N-acetylmuramoylalanine--D-glutamate ligase